MACRYLNGKRTLWFAAFILLLAMLSGCSKSGKSEKEIIADLQASQQFIANDIKISDYEIIKRQTDADNHSDTVYLTVYTDDPELICALSYRMQYTLYNDGWILESVGRSNDGPWEFSGLQDSQVISDIKNEDDYFSNFDLRVQSIKITDEQYNTNVSTYYEKQFKVQLTAQYEEFDYYASYSMFYEVSDGIWELQNASIQSRKYVPKYSVNTNALDSVMETLVMNVDLGDDLVYDDFEYLRTDADWENCREMRYYTATKSWFYGTETFLVAIPLNFNIESNSTYWSYDSSRITHTLQSVDWTLAGSNWMCDYSDVDHWGWSSPLNGYAVANLGIHDVIATNDPEIYRVKLYCNAYSTHYSYRCFAEDGAWGELHYDEGIWSLTIPKPDDLDSNFLWCGFTFFGYEHHNRQGVYWNATLDGVNLRQE